ncbi:ABC-type ATPase with predicted acetyltransferase domain [Rhizobium sp. BK650]|nr:ABC-type ATPase with predicted acetyltransferase domain [Rhizobium sp. BK650]
MLAKCPNARRVLRLGDFGKQKFFNVFLRSHSQIWPVFAKSQKIRRRRQMINVLYRLQYKFRADFAKNATIARLVGC